MTKHTDIMNIQDSKLKELAKNVLQEEANSLIKLKNFIDDDIV